MKMQGHKPERSGASRQNVAGVQVKICGLTRVAEAVACARAGARAIGCVFYPGSPRNVNTAIAAEIRRALPPEIACVAVFVDESFENLMRIVGRTGFQAVQLHGKETPELVARLLREGLFVIKTLFSDRAPGFAEAPRLSASAFLVECGQGPWPGGNARVWKWGEAAPLGERHPLILAGGLTPGNAAQAVRAACPDAVDVSSGVEASPGHKDIRKVTQLIAAVSTAGARRTIFT
jgi:phosphoribosylanthranilate isomerase